MAQLQNLLILSVRRGCSAHFEAQQPSKKGFIKWLLSIQCLNCLNTHLINIRGEVQEVTNQGASPGKVSRRLLRDSRQTDTGGVGRGDLVMGEVFFRCHVCRSRFVELHSPQQEDWFYVLSLFIHSFI